MRAHNEPINPGGLRQRKHIIQTQTLFKHRQYIINNTSYTHTRTQTTITETQIKMNPTRNYHRHLNTHTHKNTQMTTQYDNEHVHTYKQTGRKHT